MPDILPIRPNDLISLKINGTERKLISGLMFLNPTTAELMQSTPLNRPVSFSTSDLETIAGYLAAEANHTSDQKLESKMYRLFDRIEDALNKHGSCPACS